MTPELIDSYAKLGIAALMAGCLVYSFIFYIRVTTKQRDKDHIIHEGYIRALEGFKNTLDKMDNTIAQDSKATIANTMLTTRTAEAMESVGRALKDYNQFVLNYISSHPVAGGGDDANVIS